MLPPIPHGLVPVTAQQDVPKPKPAVAPVSPAQESAKGSAVTLEDDHVSEAQERARKEQHRRYQREQSQSEAGDAESSATDDKDDKKDGTELPRKGLWVDLEV
ncbi:MAG TPA: aspartate-semialdehyde dehydrogenase [Thiopseudomonas sp.]|nr:aspartate-semialdehyde dehydrogenase [Thiopseudomonas sp.]